MKIYKVSFKDDYQEHQGYEYFTSKKDALKRIKDHWNEYAYLEEDFDIKLNKNSVLQALNEHGGHPDNG